MRQSYRDDPALAGSLGDIRQSYRNSHIESASMAEGQWPLHHYLACQQGAASLISLSLRGVAHERGRHRHRHRYRH